MKYIKIDEQKAATYFALARGNGKTALHYLGMKYIKFDEQKAVKFF